jgi:hypothetical protein
MAGTAKEKLFELINDMNGSSEDEVSSTIGREYGGGLDDAYMTLSQRRSSAFADPNANSAFASPMSMGGLPTIYRQEGGDYDYDYSLEDIGLNTADFVNEDFADALGSYQDQMEEAMTRDSAPVESRRTGIPGLSELGYSPEEITSIRAAQDAALRGDPYADTRDTGPSVLDNLRRFWSGETAYGNELIRDQMLGRVGLARGPSDPQAPSFSDEAIERALPFLPQTANVYPFSVPAQGFGTATESDLYQIAAAKAEAEAAERNTSRFTSPETWMPDVNIGMGPKYGSSGEDRTSPTESMLDVNIGMGPKYGSSGVDRSPSSPESMPNVDIGAGVTPIVADAGVNIGIGKQFGSSGEDRPIDTVDPDNFITSPEARYEALYGSKKGDPTFTEGGQFIYNRLGEPQLGPNLDPEAIKARLNKEGYTRTESIYLNDLLSRGYSMKDAEDILVQGMATPGGLAAMQSGVKDGYSYGGPAGTLIDAIERGTQQTLGIGQVLQERKKRREEDKEFDKYRAGFIGEEIPKDKAEGIVGSKFLNFVGDFFGLKRGEANILDKDAISQISAKAEEQDFIYETPNNFAKIVSSFLPSKAAIPFTVLQNILPNKSVGTITSKKDGTTFSLNEDGSLTFIEDPANINYDEGPDAAPTRKSRPVKQQVSTSTEEPPKTGMAALLARRADPKKRLDTLANLQEKYRKIYGRPFETGIG